MPIQEGQAEQLFGYNPDAMSLEDFREFCKPKPLDITWQLPKPRECLDCGSPMFPVEDGEINPVWRCVRCGCPEEKREEKEVDNLQ